MNYRGHTIEPVYTTGSTFTVSERTGQIRDRKPTSKDIEYYDIYEDGVSVRVGSAFTLPEAKELIRTLNKN